jgi:hypothetical protein
MTIAVTIFPNLRGVTADEVQVTPEQIVDLIRTARADRKENLPLIKCARFGFERSPQGALRHDRNMVAITGIEGDYDGEEVDPQDAVERLREHDIEAIVYTSPSHKPMKPRWRVLCPLSREYPAMDRDTLVSRLNGALGGILEPESFTRSQSYFFGSVDEPVQTWTTKGAKIDQRPDLPTVGPHPKSLISSAPSGKIADMLKRQITQPELAHILGRMPNNHAFNAPWSPRPAWVELAHAIHGCTCGAQWAREAFVVWSAQYDGDMTEPERVWDTIRHPKAGFGTLQRMFDAWAGEGQLRRELAPIELTVHDAAPNHIPDAGKMVSPLLKTSGEFVANFVPPDYLIDNLIQRRFCYSMTAPTGHGKTAAALHMAACVALGEGFGGFPVDRGRVVYFAGENPDDVRMRWIATSDDMQFHADAVDVHFLEGALDLSQIHDRIATEVERIGGASLIVVDTAAAYFRGEDENSNTELGNFARECRRLTRLAGGPCVVVLCHPVKTPDRNNLVPRGGGAFLAEVDGNLTCWRDDTIIQLHHAGKLRGPGFDPLSLELRTVNNERLKDVRGRIVPTIIAKAITPDTARSREMQAESAENQLLQYVASRGAVGSLLDAGEQLGWLRKAKAYEVAKRLEADGLVKRVRRGLRLTALGKQEAVRLGYISRNEVEE